ncbi:MAG: hypothetical protein ACYSWZ_18870 [Planctomycetota bacterium]|jgi:DNA-binding beta-propeller fold protein YncE
MNRKGFLYIIFLVAVLWSVASAAAPKPRIYWNQKFSTTFGWCNLDGSDVQIKSVLDAQDLRRFVIHEGLGRIYWSDIPAGVISSSMSGTGTAVIWSNASGSIRGVAVDPNAGKIYWVDGGDILRVNLDGTNNETLYDDLPFSFEGLALDLKNHELYATSWSSGDIIAGPMEGGTIRSIRYLVSTGILSMGPEAIALDVKGNKMYWAHSGDGIIQRANLDGSHVETLVSGLSSPYGIDLNVKSGMMYWTDVSKIQRASMEIPFGQLPGNRTDIVTLVDGLTSANDLHLNLYPLTPMGPGFTYQGILKQQGRGATGSYDMKFSLWGDPNSSESHYKLGSTQTILDVDVNDGLFTVLVNSEGEFGPGAFGEYARWLQIEVKGPDDPDFLILSPRQLITPAPYSRD